MTFRITTWNGMSVDFLQHHTLTSHDSERHKVYFSHLWEHFKLPKLIDLETRLDTNHGEKSGPLR